MSSELEITRRRSRQIAVGSVLVGGDAPISVQSMTNTPTEDVPATVAQIQALAAVGADIVRVSVPTMEAADAFAQIRQQVDTPLVTDIHYDYKIALKVAATGADCLRINPGNIGREDRIKAVIQAAKDNGIPIRIGVNAGSLERDLLHKYKEPTSDAMVESAMRHAGILLDHDFHDFKVSVKASSVDMTLQAYRKLASQLEQPLHLGVTEAGTFRTGTVKSAVALGALLLEGIGDTIRVSLAADPIEEIRVGFDILKSLGVRNKGVNIIACPSCSRQNFDVIATVNELEARLEDIIEPVDLAVIGCLVNGPGEARVADVGLTGGTPNNLSYMDGEKSHHVRVESIVDELERMVREKVKRKQADQAAGVILRSGVEDSLV